MDNDIVKKLMYSGLITALGAVAAIVAHKAADQIWIRLMGEDPPTD